jgi:hypothetical protein
MAYNATLERRIDTTARSLDMYYGKRKMFGGLAYFARGGYMAFAIRGDEILVRIHDSEAGELMDRSGIHSAIMGGRLMHDWLQAGGQAIEDDGKLADLLTIGYDYALSLPPKGSL